MWHHKSIKYFINLKHLCGIMNKSKMIIWALLDRLLAFIKYCTLWVSQKKQNIWSFEPSTNPTPKSYRALIVDNKFC